MDYPIINSSGGDTGFLYGCRLYVAITENMELKSLTAAETNDGTKTGSGHKPGGYGLWVAWRGAFAGRRYPGLLGVVDRVLKRQDIQTAPSRTARALEPSQWPG